MQVVVKDTGSKVKINDEIFGYDFNESLIHQSVVAHLNNSRSGNSAQKTRSEVRGGGKKPWRQKGTGRARAGTIRSPIWRGGGATFAAKKRDYSQKLNKKMYKRAMRSIISELFRNKAVTVVSAFECEDHKAKNFMSKMNEFKLDNALIVLSEVSENEYLATRNLYDFEVCDVECLDPVVLLKFEKILITKDALKKLEEQLQ